MEEWAGIVPGEFKFGDDADSIVDADDNKIFFNPIFSTGDFSIFLFLLTNASLDPSAFFMTTLLRTVIRLLAGID